MLTNLYIPFGLVVRIPGFHPGGPGSIPGMGTFSWEVNNAVSISILEHGWVSTQIWNRGKKKKVSADFGYPRMNAQTAKTAKFLFMFVNVIYVLYLCDVHIRFGKRKLWMTKKDK